MDTLGLGKRIATFGGPVRVNHKNDWMYAGSKKRSLKEMYGIKNGPIHFGLPYKEELAVEASQSDTKVTLVRELTDQSGLTKREAEDTVDKLIKDGVLIEVDDPDLGKVLVFRR